VPKRFYRGLWLLLAEDSPMATQTTSTQTTTMTKTPSIGDKAPNFVLVNGKGPDGKATFYNLHEACKNGPVILAFFPGAFTGTCTKEMCRFSDDWSEWSMLKAQFVGVSVDSWHAQKAFAEKNGIKVPMASDFERKAINTYGVVWNSWWGPTAKRATFIVDRNATVQYANVQTNMDLEPNYAEIRAALSKVK
jgi:peroxiredoxin